MKKAVRILTILLPVSGCLTIAAGIMLFFLPSGTPAVFDATKGYGPFDMRLNYTADAFMTILSPIEGDRIKLYTDYFILDYILTVCFALTAVSLPVFIYIQDDTHYLLFRSTLFSAIAMTVFNVTENIMIMNIVNNTPIFTDGEANFSSGITTLKWAFIALWSVSAILLSAVTITDKIVSLRSKK